MNVKSGAMMAILLIGLGWAGNAVAGGTAQNLSVSGSVSCPANVSGNTTTNNGSGNLVLEGFGCNSVNNLAP